MRENGMREDKLSGIGKGTSWICLSVWCSRPEVGRTIRKARSSTVSYVWGRWTWNFVMPQEMSLFHWYFRILSFSEQRVSTVDPKISPCQRNGTEDEFGPGSKEQTAGYGLRQGDRGHGRCFHRNLRETGVCPGRCGTGGQSHGSQNLVSFDMGRWKSQGLCPCLVRFWKLTFESQQSLLPLYNRAQLQTFCLAFLQYTMEHDFQRGFQVMDERTFFYVTSSYMEIVEYIQNAISLSNNSPRTATSYRCGRRTKRECLFMDIPNSWQHFFSRLFSGNLFTWFVTKDSSTK